MQFTHRTHLHTDRHTDSKHMTLRSAILIHGPLQCGYIGQPSHGPINQFQFIHTFIKY